MENFGLLFVVGEERDSTGAAFANEHPRGSRFLINGEPTENRLALGCKGALRPVLEARGRSAHSAYPELGESAIEKLLTALVNLRSIPLPSDDLLGASTYNIGLIEGGCAPNVIPDRAQAEVLFRLVGSSEPVKQAIARAVAGLGRGPLRAGDPRHPPRSHGRLPDDGGILHYGYSQAEQLGTPLLSRAWVRPGGTHGP